MTISHGITGNYYVTSRTLPELHEVCENIGKSKNSIYRNKKYKVWAIRVKNKTHKNNLKKIYL